MNNIKDIRNPENYIDNLYDIIRQDYDIKRDCVDATNTIIVEHRSNNPKRDFLFVNKKQCKHIPASPVDMMSMCKQLAYSVNNGLREKYGKHTEELRILIVGFAETATAIGTIVGDYLCDYGLNIVEIKHTTRENVDGSVKLLTFEEEHSHATTQQLLSKVGVQYYLDNVDYVLFVEDEISTGNTILNFINEFKKEASKYGVDHAMEFGVASVCNWQDKANRVVFGRHNIDRFYLISGSLKDANAKMLGGVGIEVLPDKDYTVDNNVDVTRVYVKAVDSDDSLFYLNRTGHTTHLISNSNLLKSDGLFSNISEMLSDCKSVRVIGTEECMELPIKLGAYLEILHNKVVHCHATTRSKIDVIPDDSTGEWGAIKHRYNLTSAYDCDRKTFIYNMEAYTDAVVLVTDSNNNECIDKLTSEIASIANTRRVILVVVG